MLGDFAQCKLSGRSSLRGRMNGLRITAMPPSFRLQASLFADVETAQLHPAPKSVGGADPNFISHFRQGLEDAGR